MKNYNDIISLGDYLRSKGRYGDSVLAHISPEEADLLKEMGGSGTINPDTGLPEYFIPTLLSSIMSDPKMLMAAGNTAGSLYNNFFKKDKKPKEKSGRERGLDDLDYILASEVPARHKAEYEKDLDRYSRMSEDEIRDSYAYDNRLERAEWEARNNLNPGETLNIDPLYRKENDEDEFKRTGRWFEYYNDPGFKGKRVYMAHGGKVKHPKENFMEIEIIAEPQGYTNDVPSLSDLFKDFLTPHDDFVSGYIDGEDGGQEDTIEARLSPGEYVIDAETVANLGDGNSKAGARKLDEFIRSVRKHKRSSGDCDIAPRMSDHRG